MVYGLLNLLVVFTYQFSLKDVKGMLDKASESINGLKLSNKHSIAQKCSVIYNEQVQKTQLLGTEYESLYKRFLQYKAKQKVADYMKNGQMILDEEEENSEMNQSIKDIQANTMLSKEQRRVRVEAEVLTPNYPYRLSNT
jgi:urease gamma subunit